MSSAAEILVRKALEIDDKPVLPTPPGFVALFQRHLDAYPDDDNFLLTKDDIFGVVTCMEASCFLDIPLDLDPSLADGGRARGVGSFANFQKHINNTPAHRASRDNRAKSKVKREPAPVAAAFAQPAPQFGARALDHNNNASSSSNRNPSFGSPANAQAAAGGSGLQRDPKPKGLKRASSGILCDPDAPHADKKPKLASPGVLVARNNGAVGPVGAVAVPAVVSDAVTRIARQEAQYRKYLADLQSLPSNLREPTYYTRIDQANQVIMACVQQRQAITKAYGNIFPAAAGAPAAAAAAAPQRAGGAPGNAIFDGVGADDAADAGALLGLGALAGGAGARQWDDDAAGPLMPSNEEFVRFISAISKCDAHADCNLLFAMTFSYDEFLKAAAEGADFEGNSTVDDAVESLGLTSQQDRIEGMKITLMAHQLIGVAWMVKQEASKSFGGILADEMGLGKTVQTIGIMAKNKSNDLTERTNLIVAPLALLQQWKDEIETKMEPNFFKVFIYHGKDKLSKKKLLEYDVVLTTYGTLAGEWTDEEQLAKKAKKNDEDVDEDMLTIRPLGTLFTISWYRIILDEAQQIKNRQTRISKAVAQLDALYRWCLTGTPITNSLADVFGLLRFCQIRPWYNWSEFNNTVARIEKKKPDAAARKCQVILKTVLLRRKKDSKLDGKDLITLPSKTVEMRELEFSPEEREIYNFVETRSQATFNKYLKAGTVLKNYAHVLVMLLRLRQVCIHPCLISEGFDALAIGQEEESKREEEIARATRIAGAAFVYKMRKARLELAASRIEAEKKSKDAELEDADCPICFEPLENGYGDSQPSRGMLTNCGHEFCYTCIQEVLVKPLAEDLGEDQNLPQYAQNERPCPTCRGPISADRLFCLAAFEPTDDEVTKETGAKAVVLDEDDEFQAGPVGVKQKNRAVVLDSDDEEELSVLDTKMSIKKSGKMKEDDSESSKKKKPLSEWMDVQEPSTKMKWLLEEINRVRKESPDDKIIVLSQFTKALDLFESFLDQQGVKNIRYDGSMSRKDRDANLRVLSRSTKIKIMLLSTKCGGVGLNLIRANRVINMDLCWSHAVEAQAFDRVHRLGQTKPVFVDRITILNSVEQRIGAMQDRKKGLADASLGEGNGAKVGRLSVAE